MELRLLSKTDKRIELEVIGENDTLLNLLKEHLVAQSSVKTATYIMGHPYLENPRFVLEVNDGKADAALKTAAKELRGKYDEFETLLVRAAQR